MNGGGLGRGGGYYYRGGTLDERVSFCLSCGATSAAEYAERGVYMNAVDTGWINDENPLETAARIAEVHGFQTPIDEEDAAARCVAPALEGFAAMSLLGEDAPKPPFGKFFKDYRETEW